VEEITRHGGIPIAAADEGEGRIVFATFNAELEREKGDAESAAQGLRACETLRGHPPGRVKVNCAE
jgi:hypothetical protein